MRTRKWILFVAGSLVAVIGLAYMGWRWTSANQRIKALILERVRPFLSQETDIGDMDVGMSSVHFRRVVVAPKDGSFRLEIDDVSLGYSLINLFKYRFAAHKVPHEIMLVGPTLVLKHPQQTASMSHDSIPAHPVDLQAVTSEALGVRRITMAQASVWVEDSTGHRVRLGHDLNGWLLAAPADSAHLRLDGHIFDSPDKNVRVEGRLNLMAGRPLWLSARVSDSEPAEQLPFLLPKEVVVERGRLGGDIGWTQGQGATGSLHLKDADFRLASANLRFDSVGLEIALQGNRAELKGEARRFNGSPLMIEGSMSPLLDPEINALFTVPELQLRPFFSVLLGPSAPLIEGQVHAELRFSGGVGDPLIQGQVRGQGLSVYTLPLDRFSADVRFEGGRLDFWGSGSQQEGITLGLDGRVAIAADSLPSTFHVAIGGNARRLLPESLLSVVPSCRIDWRMDLEGAMGNLRGQGDGMMTPVFLQGDSLHLYPQLTYGHRSAKLTLRSNRALRLDGRVDGLFSPDLRWSSTVQGIEALAALMAGDKAVEALESLRLSGGFSGTPALWTVAGRGDLPADTGLRTVMDFTLRSEAGNPRTLELDGRYFGDDGNPLPWQVQAVNRQGGIVIENAKLAEFLRFSGALPLGASAPQRGEVRLDGLRIEDLHGAFSSLKPYRGRLFGGVIWSGKNGDPRIRVNLQLKEGQFFSNSLYEGEAEYLRQAGRFSHLGLEIRRDDRVMLSGDVERTAADSLSGTIQGQAIDWGDLIFALSGSQKAFTGVGDLALSVLGTPMQPIVVGELTAQSGQMGPFRYDDLCLDLADTTAHDGSFPTGTLSIRRGRVERDDGLKVLLWGDVDHGSANQSDLSMLAQGNVLALLTDVSGFVRSAASEGELLLRWGRSSEGWALGGARLAFENGELGLADVVPKVRRMRGRAHLDPETRFLKIEEISGEAGGGRLTVVGRDSLPLPRLAIPSLGVDLGVLELMTTDKGIRLHLPGLMEKEDVGWFVFKGPEGKGGVRLSGPPSNPRLIGALHIRDLRVTYPFLKTGKDGEKGPKVDFLTALDWDLDIIPDKDVHYVRQVENPLGNVYTDLQLREGLGGLHLQGIIDEGELELWGNLVSTEGNVEVLDHLFRPERIAFDYPRGSESPFISGRAFTTIIDSMGMPSTVWLNITSTDDDTGIQHSGGPWDKVRFRFSTDNPNLGRTEADLMAALGYSTSHLKDRAYMALGLQVENRVFRPLFRPLEQGLRRHLGLDVVRVSSMFSRNFFQANPLAQWQWDPWVLLRSTKFTLGKYFSPGLFVTYSGQVHDGYRYQYPLGGLGIRHALILEYTIRPDLFLEMEYTYDTQLLSERREDKRIWLRHVFPF